jgi:xanthine dehydrogenase accessory factor
MLHVINEPQLEDFYKNWNGTDPFALATVIRTERSTSVDPGAKAIITSSGKLKGWIGGGCVRGTVRKVALEIMKSGEPRLIRVKPQDEVTGEYDKDGTELYKSGCPSKGIIDVFLEPVLPKPMLVLFGVSPVACRLSELAIFAGFHVVWAIKNAQDLDEKPACEVVEDFDLSKINVTGPSFTVVSTQGAHDFEALSRALQANSDYISVVGSRKKLDALKERLRQDGKPNDVIDRIKGPAGLDIGARAPSEIAISIMAEIIQHRRAVKPLTLLPGEAAT